LKIYTLAAVKALDLMANEAERGKNIVDMCRNKRERKKVSFLKKICFYITGKKRGKEMNGCKIIQLHPDGIWYV
jgi:hypothetical protein